MAITLRVKTCCCGSSLRAGTMLIGTLDFILALTTVIISSIAAVNAQNYYWWDGYWEVNPMDNLRPMYITLALLSSIVMITDILLLTGVSQAKPRMIIPWIAYSFITVVSNFVSAFIYGMYSLTYYYDSYGYIGISWAFVYLVLKLYFILVVWSYYHQMKEVNVQNNGVHVTVYPTVPAIYPNGQQTYPNGQQMYPNGAQFYPSVQLTNTNAPQPYPNAPQPYPNAPQPYPDAPQPYPNAPLPNIQQPYPSPQVLPPAYTMNSYLVTN